MKKIILYFSIFLLAFLLRAPFVAQVPVSLYWEETILGYDAYSLALTGRDHHGNPWPIVALESFGDWKPTGYVYALLPFIKTFGLQPWVVRLPSLMAGLSLVIAVGVLARRLRQPPWLSMLLLAVSPWSIHFSRAAWEAHVATAFITWGIICALKALDKKRLSFWPALSSLLLLSVAWYTYHAARVAVPLIAIGLLAYAILMLYERGTRESFLSTLQTSIKRSWPTLVGCGILLLVALTPLLFGSGSTALTHRFTETGRFADPSVIIRSNELIQEGGNTKLAKLAYHRYVLWGADIMDAYFDNLSPSFLFLNGEENPRHTTGYMGLFYPFEFLFFMIGLGKWLSQRRLMHGLLIYVSAVSLIPAAITVPTPHALRIMTALPFFTLLIASGVWQSIEWLQMQIPNYRYVPYLLLIIVYEISLGIFWYHYTFVYKYLSASEWQDGYKEMIFQVNQFEDEYPHYPIYITRTVGRPAAYVWFYTKTDPQEVQKQNNSVSKDQGEYLTFGSYHFVRSQGEIPSENAIVAMTSEEFALYEKQHSVSRQIEIKSADSRVAWVVGVQ